MQLNTYAQQARSTATYSGRGSDLGKFYAALKLAGEAGEVADAIGKSIGRGEFEMPFYGKEHAALREKVRDELGDVLWQLVAVADEFELSLDEIAERNGQKLTQRAQRGTLLGGDRSNEIVETVVEVDDTAPLSAVDLDRMPAGSRVVTAQGATWEKSAEPFRWLPETVDPEGATGLTATSLIASFGPVTLP